MSDEPKKREPAITVQCFWQMLKNAGIAIPDNCNHILVDARAGGVVEVYWKTFADSDLSRVVAKAMVPAFGAEESSMKDIAQKLRTAHWNALRPLGDDVDARDWWELSDKERWAWEAVARAL